MDILDNSLKSSPDDIQLKSEVMDDPKPMMSNNLTIIEEDGSMSDDQGVDSLAHAQAILEAEDDGHYHWKTDDGVTYRVFQVSQDEEADGEMTNDFQSSSTHVPPVAAVLTSASNHFYVVGNDVLTSPPPRTLAPRSNFIVENRATLSSPPAASTRVRRDDRRRATHNEVERRRRDKINNWIMKLSKIIPDCTSIENNKIGLSKGGILAKACDYIVSLRNSSQKVNECMKENEQLKASVEYLMQQVDKLKKENAMLKKELCNGAEIVPDS